MWVSRGLPIRLPIGEHHRGTTPSARQDENRAPERQPSRASDFGMLTEPSSELPWHYPSRAPNSQSISRAKQRVPAAKNRHFVQPWSKQAILRSLKAKTRDYLRYRKAHTRTTGKNVHFSLPIPRKTVCFDRQRPKATVFRIAHPESGAQRRSAAPGQRWWSPGRRGSRHRGGKTAQNRGRDARAGSCPGEGRGPQWGHSAGVRRQSRARCQGGGRGPQSRGHSARARVVALRAAWVAAS